MRGLARLARRVGLRDLQDRELRYGFRGTDAAADEATAAFDRAVLAMNAGDAAAERKQLEQARAALERANRLVRLAAQQMIPYAHIPTERHILYLFNDAIPSHEATQRYLSEVVALRNRPGR